MAPRARYRMGQLKNDQGTYRCFCGRQWPPGPVLAYGTDLQEIRSRVSSAEYDRVRVWDHACGLLQMREDKCLKCPYVKLNGILINNQFGNTSQKPKSITATLVATKRQRALEIREDSEDQ